ncbi:tetratricopeptide repeat protein [Allosphingosinicella sp.]|jgi:hypothetical protein|uniref:tetratricopeptide repeat protein n=1 Tax=Allosphingosinicella sp. TaxID=2823234 RepID=UPI002F08BC54
MRNMVRAAAAVALIGGAANAAAAIQPNGAPPIAPITGSIRPPAETIEQLRMRAEGGDRGAQLDLGLRLLETADPAQHAEARRWFQRASDAGHPEAKNALATVLMYGRGGPADEALGRRLMEEAAREGSFGANLSLAERYLRGAEGYPRDPGRALRHTRAAAASSGPGGLFAQWRLAMMHLHGVGTPRDPQAAYRILVAASDAGGVNAMISRAVMLATGEGIVADPAAARLWYQRAAESGQRGFEHGLRGWGAMLSVGQGGPADLPRGIAYLRIAAAANDEHASTILEQLEPRITAEVDGEAQRIAGEWMRRHLPTR